MLERLMVLYLKHPKPIFFTKRATLLILHVNFRNS